MAPKRKKVPEEEPVIAVEPKRKKKVPVEEPVTVVDKSKPLQKLKKPDAKELAGTLRFDALSLTPTFVESIQNDDPKMFVKLGKPAPNQKVEKHHLETFLKVMKIGIDDLFARGIVRSKNEEVSRMKRIVKKKNRRVRAASKVEKQKAAKSARTSAHKAALKEGKTKAEAKDEAEKAALKAAATVGKVSELSMVTKNLKVVKYTIKRGQGQISAKAPKVTSPTTARGKAKAKAQAKAKALAKRAEITDTFTTRINFKTTPVSNKVINKIGKKSPQPKAAAVPTGKKAAQKKAVVAEKLDPKWDFLREA